MRKKLYIFDIDKYIVLNEIVQFGEIICILSHN
jgi:hypothetical protein